MVEKTNIPVGFEEVTDIPEGFEEVKEEIAPEVQEESEAIQAGLMGTLQGITAGFSEELGAGIHAAGHALGIESEEERVNRLLREEGFKGEEIKEKTTLEKYKELRDIGREEQKRLQEKHGVVYGAGELVGGAAPALLSGGAAALGKEGLKQAALAGAKAGAITGAVEGVGHGEAEDVGGMVKEAAVGAGTGAVLGSVLPVVGKGVKEVGKGLKKAGETVVDVVPGAEKLTDIFKKSFGGERLVSKKVQGARVKESTGEVGDFISDFGKKVKEEGSKIGEIVKSDSEKTGQTVDIGNILKRYKDETKELLKRRDEKTSKSAGTLLDKLDQAMPGNKTELNAEDIYEARKIIQGGQYEGDVISKSKELTASLDQFLRGENSILSDQAKEEFTQHFHSLFLVNSGFLSTPRYCIFFSNLALNVGQLLFCRLFKRRNISF